MIHKKNLCVLFLIFELYGASGANILGVFLFPSFSHQQVFQSLCKELSLRGHNVTMLSPIQMGDENLENLTEITLQKIYSVFTHKVSEKFLSSNPNIFEKISGPHVIGEIVSEAHLNDPDLQELLSSSNQERFDLILLEYLHPTLLILASKLKTPLLCVTSLGVTPTSGISSFFGRPNHPLLYPDTFMEFDVEKISFYEKILLLFQDIWAKYLLGYSVLPKANSLMKKFFGPSFTTSKMAENPPSLFLLNANSVLQTPRPEVPTFIKMGQVHMRRRTLPNEIKNFLDDANNGAIYVSFGSIVSLENTTIGCSILHVLEELPYRVILKWRSFHHHDNILIRSWLPQQDILRHPNVRAFVTQGGLQSIEEAITNGVPLVGLPFIADQPMNIKRIAELGVGIKLDRNRLEKSVLRAAIIDVVENKRYRNNINSVRKLLYDKPLSGLDNAVWWVEYAVRHKKLNYMRSPYAEVSLGDYLLIDVMAFSLFSICIFYLSSRLLCHMLKKSKIK